MSRRTFPSAPHTGVGYATVEAAKLGFANDAAKDRLILVGAVRMWGALQLGRPMREVLEFIRSNPALGETIEPGALS